MPTPRKPPVTPPRLVLTTADRSWFPGEIVPLASRNTSDETWSFDRFVPCQTIDGFGGCFNEQGWAVLRTLNQDDRQHVLRTLFDLEAGCGFMIGRLPMGANDYSMDWYSYAETRDDYELRGFSIERDRHSLIPYVEAARQLSPTLRFWASPWCPPSWMKTNGHYAGRVSPNNDLRPEQAGREMETQFRMEPRVLAAYAHYFVRYIEEYDRAGIPISAVHVQNEPNSAQDFPSCVWRPEDLATFIGRYLGPVFRARGLDTEIWLGTIERPQPERVEAALATDEARQFISGIGFQWAGKDAIPLVHRANPAMPLMQTESECGNGANDWAAALHTFGLMRHYLSHGARSYLYWNMVLDETGNSRWGWKQNALISVHRQTHQVTLNPEYYIMRHFSAWVRPGAVRIELPGTDHSALAFRNQDSSTAVVFANSRDSVRRIQVITDGERYQMVLPAHCVGTLIF